MLSYLVLDEWEDGFPVDRAIKDAQFALGDNGGIGPDGPSRSSKAYVTVDPHDDQVTAICKTSLYLKTTEVPAQWKVLDTADPVSTQERLEAYVEVCKEIFGTLERGGKQRALLEAFHPPLGVPKEVLAITSPALHGPYGPHQYVNLRSRRDEAAAAKPDLTPRFQPLEEAEPPYVRSSLATNGVRAVRPVIVPGSEVADAIYNGRVVQFDATEILPKSLFNLNLSTIAEMHGDMAESIPIYKQRGASSRFGWTSLREAGERLDLLQEAGKLYHADQVPVPREPQNLPVPPEPRTKELNPDMLVRSYRPDTEKALLNLEHELSASPKEAGIKDIHDAMGHVLGKPYLAYEAHSLFRSLSQTTTNIRRLPKLPIVDLKEALGNPDWMERSWSMLWAGAVGSWWHNDEPDNLLIAVNKEMTVAVFEMNDTELISGMRGPFSPFFDLAEFHPDKVNPEWLENNQWIKKFPYIRVHLKPGMGVTVPSRTYHTIWTQDSERLLLNAFLLPKYGALVDAPRPNTSFYAPGQQSELYMALMHLKFTTLGRLWDTRKLGGWFEITKLEIF